MTEYEHLEEDARGTDNYPMAFVFVGRTCGDRLIVDALDAVQSAYRGLGRVHAFEDGCALLLVLGMETLLLDRGLHPDRIELSTAFAPSIIDAIRRKAGDIEVVGTTMLPIGRRTEPRRR